MKEVVEENEVYTISCTVESSPEATLTLNVYPKNQKNDRVIETTVRSNVLSFTTNASVSDAGRYTCAAKNSEGENYSAKQLTVLCKSICMTNFPTGS